MNPTQEIILYRTPFERDAYIAVQDYGLYFVLFLVSTAIAYKTIDAAERAILRRVSYNRKRTVTGFINTYYILIMGILSVLYTYGLYHALTFIVA